MKIDSLLLMSSCSVGLHLLSKRKFCLVEALVIRELKLKLYRCMWCRPEDQSISPSIKVLNTMYTQWLHDHTDSKAVEL